MAKNKYICIHGHFYQPPRENAWLEEVELQDSAAPFHDWNERINFECYAPNTAARILDQDGRIVDIVNNYSRINFNFGPTLLSWLERKDEATYLSILDADRRSQERFGGYGSAIAQVYSHLIMPLANRRDKETQIIWGLRDFEFRFGRPSDGIWLAETAVDTETLELLVDHGVRYTILAPRQAKAFRRVGEKEWHTLDHASVDPRHPYRYTLPSGRSISLFFYHGGISQGVAFEGLLNDGKRFADAFVDVFDDDDVPQLAHIATDGESYGHHHRYGEMALAACLKNIENSSEVTLCNYAQYLDQFPPEYEIQIHENSSWSCVHGVERWRSDCGCSTGGNLGWTQEWRTPLRETLNWLRDKLIPVYEQQAGQYLNDAWAARNAYISTLLRRSNSTVENWLDEYARYPLSQDDRVCLFRLLEMQRHAMLMFTSCGWFFDEISGIETDQILQYANRAIHYLKQVTGIDLHDYFTNRLSQAKSNVYENGASSYIRNVVPARVDLIRMGMHYAATSLFERTPEELDMFNYHVHSDELRRVHAGTQILVTGRTTVQSKSSFSRKQFSFAVLYLGQQNIIGNISVDMEVADYQRMSELLVESFENTNLGEVIGLMQDYFGSDKFSIWHLFRDEKRKILRNVTDRNLEQVESAFRNIFNDNYQLMTGMQRSNIPLPKGYLSAVSFILNHDLNQFFESMELNLGDIKRLAYEFPKWQVDFSDLPSFALAGGERIYREIQLILAESVSQDTKRIENLTQVIEILQRMRLNINYWKSQNLYYSMLRSYRNLPGSERVDAWEAAFKKLGQQLNIKNDSLVAVATQ